MEQTEQVSADASTVEALRLRLLGRMALRSLALGGLGFFLGIGAFALEVGSGALAGSLVAGLYCWGFVASHLGQAGRSKILDGPIVKQTGFRVAILGILSAAIWLSGREVFAAYLISFGVSFALLLGLEGPRVARELRNRGFIGSRS